MLTLFKYEYVVKTG